MPARALGSSSARPVRTFSSISPRSWPPVKFTEWRFTYPAPWRMARSALTKSPAVMPWEVGPVTFAAVMLPDMVPDVAAGQAGWPPPPHNQIMTPPATWISPKWMCDKIALLERPENVSVKVILPSSWMTARNEAVPLLLIAGTSFAPRRLAVRMVTSSSEAAVATLNAATSSANNRNLFMFGFSPSFDDFGGILGRCGGDPAGIPDLEPVQAQYHTATTRSRQSQFCQRAYRGP